MASINVSSLRLYVVRQPGEMFKALSLRFGFSDAKSGWSRLNQSCAIDVFPQQIIQFWYEEKKLTRSICCRIFYELDTRVWHGIFSDRLCEQDQFISTVFLTSLTYQSYSRCDTMRMKSVPEGKDTSLVCGFCFLLNVSPLALINKPFSLEYLS